LGTAEATVLIMANRSMNGFAAADAATVAINAQVANATSTHTLRLLAVCIVITAPVGAH
jgi:hypothetical protein